MSARARLLRFICLGFALAAVAVGAAACGGGSAPSGVASVGSATTSTVAPAGNSGGPPTADETKALLKFSSCIQAHGVPDFPDPRSAGGFPDSARKFEDSPSYQSAETSCKADAIASGVIQSPAELAQHLKQLEAQDACIRKHGVPNMPGPTATGEQTFPAGIVPRSPQLQKALQACSYLNP
jgi:hypothetical protein